MLINLTDKVGSISAESITKKVIDLNGPQGNAFYLMGAARNLATQIGLDGSAVIKEMMSGDYVNVVATFEHYFGSIMYLILPESMSREDVEYAVQEKGVHHV
jgi:hypothetical protein